MAEFDHKDKRAKHMAQRYSQIKSLAKLGEEFGLSKSHSHRIVNSAANNNEDEHEEA